MEATQVSERRNNLLHHPEQVCGTVPQTPNLTDHAERLHDRLHDLDLALQTGDTESAYRAARELRIAAEVICGDLLQKYLALPATDAELSEVAHG